MTCLRCNDSGNLKKYLIRRYIHSQSSFKALKGTRSNGIIKYSKAVSHLVFALIEIVHCEGDSTLSHFFFFFFFFSLFE